MSSLPDQGIWPYVTLVFRTSLAIVFLSAGAAKFRDGGRFERAVRAFRLVPTRWLPRASRAIPAVEIVVGAGLFLGLLAPWPLVAATILLAAFTAAVGINVLRGRRDLECGCFGSRLVQRVGPSLLLRNLSLTSAALALVALGDTGTQAWPFRSRESIGIAEGAIAMIGTSAFSLMLLAAPTLRVALFPAGSGSEQSRREEPGR